MKSKILLLLAGAVALALVLSLVAVLRPATVVRVVERFGSVAGSDFLDGITVTVEKGRDGVISNDADALLTATEVCEQKYIELGYATATQAVTLPSSANLTVACFKAPEDTRTLILRNASSGPSAINIVAGASSSIFSQNTATSGIAQAGLVSRATTTMEAGSALLLRGVRIVSSTQPWILWFVESFR